jgi:hypothetical protein
MAKARKVNSRSVIEKVCPRFTEHLEIAGLRPLKNQDLSKERRIRLDTRDIQACDLDSSQLIPVRPGWRATSILDQRNGLTLSDAV